MKSIAVIDDDIYIGDMMEEVLKKEGYEVLRAYSGTEAVYLLKEHRPDLVLLDLMLPGLSGEQVLPLIRGIPVIVVSARADVGDKSNCFGRALQTILPNPLIQERCWPASMCSFARRLPWEAVKALFSGSLGWIRPAGA